MVFHRWTSPIHRYRFMPCISDIHQTCKTLRQQKAKTHQKMKDLTIELATHSKYNSMNRSTRRKVEYDMDRVNEEKNLQRDVRKAGVMAKRIAQVLDQLHKETQKIKNHLGNYNFTNTVGMDSSASGDCADDLSTDIGTRQAWKKELANMIEMTHHYLSAQYLGDYAILHANVDQSNCTSSCCTKQYRSVFHYATPRGDCLSLQPSMGNAYTETSNIDVSNDAKNAPTAHGHNQVTNCDVDYEHAYNLFVAKDSVTEISVILASFNDAINSDKNTSYAAAENSDSIHVDGNGIIVANYNANRVASIKLYMETEDCLPEALVSATLENFSNDNTLTIDVSNIVTDADTLAHMPSIDNIDDESDMSYIMKYFTNKMVLIRGCQETNDREQSVLEFVKETSECNQQFYQDSFNEDTYVDVSETKSKYEVGKQICSDLDVLYKDVCVSKQTFFTKHSFCD